MDEIKYIDRNLAENIIFGREPRGLFIIKEDVWVGIDNLSGDAWVEEFDTEKKCIKWLKNR
jgi:hypothetical protein